MRQVLLPSVVLFAVIQTALWVPAVAAPPTPAQRKELTALASDLRKVGPLISKKKYDEAETSLTEIEAQLTKLQSEAEYADNDKQLATVRRNLEQQRAALAKGQEGKGGANAAAVSFSKDIAPLLADRCGNCHSTARASGGLSLESFATMERGGRSGPLLIAGNPNASLLMGRLMAANPMQRMPRNGEAFTPEELRKVASWIVAGAPFDGSEKNVALSLLKNNPDLAKMKIEIPKPTGNETVSFVKDIAPTFVNTCGGCHGANNPRSGFSLATFERLMAGGASGQVIVPGKPDESRLWRLVNADDSPVMPQGNMARITRKWHADLRTWITEGAKYDATDPRRPLSELIPSQEQMRIEALAKMTPEDWLEKRRKDAQDMWERTYSQGAEAATHETSDLLVMGDVSPRRLEEIGNWGQEQIATLKPMFEIKEAPVFKGKLILFVFRERFGYEEFNNTIHRRQIPREVIGHSDVSAGQDQAFAAVQEIGDEISATNPGMQLNVAEQVTTAILKREGGNLPDWLAKGTGLALAAEKGGGKSNPYLTSMHSQTFTVLQKASLQNPADVFKSGQFSPADVGPVGYSLVNFLLQQGGSSKFGQLVRRAQAGDAPDVALRTAYGTDPRQLANAFMASVAARRK